MSTIDTSTWNPDPALNESIGDIPLNANASIQQTWQAIQMLMAAGGLHGLQLVTFDGATASADGASGLVPKPLAGDQDKFLKGDGTWETVATAIEAALDTILKTKIYPVGSTYFSLTDSRNPSTILGFGTWAKIEGRFLLGASSSYAADSTGGEAAHTLTESEMPQHYHDSLRYKTPTAAKFGCNSGNLPDTNWTVPWNDGRAQDYYVTGYAGGSQAHNNMPPYLAGYLWRRTA